MMNVFHLDHINNNILLTSTISDRIKYEIENEEKKYKVYIVVDNIFLAFLHKNKMKNMFIFNSFIISPSPQLYYKQFYLFQFKHQSTIQMNILLIYSFDCYFTAFEKSQWYKHLFIAGK